MSYRKGVNSFKNQLFLASWRGRQQYQHLVAVAVAAKQSLPYRRFIRDLERQLVVTSGLKEEVGLA